MPEQNLSKKGNPMTLDLYHIIGALLLIAFIIYAATGIYTRGFRDTPWWFWWR